MAVILWYLVIGALLVTMAAIGTLVNRLPLTGSMLYLAVGFGLGPTGLGLLHIDPVRDAGLLERLAEVAVLISLFTAGLKLSIPVRDHRWRLSLRLAVVAMTISVLLVAAVGLAIGLPLGAAVLLGAILAPTDPVLASDVQVRDPRDRDRLRFTLTGEAGLNDGTAFPFVMLGLGLLGLHDLGAGGWRWVVVDLVWASVGGLAIGWLLGAAVGKLVLYLRRVHREALGLDLFLALGLIALSYGFALALDAYGFLAVFAAGLSLRNIELNAHSNLPVRQLQEVAGTSDEIASDPKTAPAFMVQAVLSINEQFERIAEVVLVLLLGSMLALPHDLAVAALLICLLMFVIRPASVMVGLIRTPTPRMEKAMMSWFGIRGIGSLYYLAFAIHHGLPGDLSRTIADLVLAVVAVSVILHGISVTPLMEVYGRLRRRRRSATTPAEEQVSS